MTKGTRYCLFLSSHWTSKNLRNWHSRMPLLINGLSLIKEMIPICHPCARGIPNKAFFSVVHFKFYHKVGKICTFWAEYCCDEYNVSCLKHLSKLLQPQELCNQKHFFITSSVFEHVAFTFWQPTLFSFWTVTRMKPQVEQVGGERFC